MNTNKIVRTVAATMAVLMATLAVAPSAQADSTTVRPSSAATLEDLSVGANYSGPCPGPLVQCLTYLVFEYCQMSPTCHLVIVLADRVLDIVLDAASDVITIAVWLIDRTTQLLYDVVELVVDYVFDLVGYVYDIVGDVVSYLVHLLLDLVDDARRIADRLIDRVGQVIKPFLDYAYREVAALAWLLKQVVDEVCWVLIGGCPWVTTSKRLTAQREYAATDNSWADVNVAQAAFA